MLVENDGIQSKSATRMMDAECYIREMKDGSGFFRRNPPRPIPVFNHKEIHMGLEIGHGQYGFVREVTEIEGVSSDGILQDSCSKISYGFDDGSSNEICKVSSLSGEDVLTDYCQHLMMDDDNYTASTTKSTDESENFTRERDSVKKQLSQTVSRRSDGGISLYRYAVKELRPSLTKHATAKALRRAAGDLVKEACFLASIAHPNIIRLRATVGTPGTPEYMLMLDRLYDTVDDRIQRWKVDISTQNSSPLQALWTCGKNPLADDLGTRATVAFDIARACRYLHKNRIIHRDLKPENVAFSIRDDVRLFDFGLAKELKPELMVGIDLYRCTAMTGSLRWMAPEVYFGKNYGLSADVYSFGLILWNLCSLEIPYGKTITAPKLRARVMVKGERPRRLPFVSATLNKLISECVYGNSHNRPTFHEICQTLSCEDSVVVENVGSIKAILNRSTDLLSCSVESILADKSEHEQNVPSQPALRTWQTEYLKKHVGRCGAKNNGELCAQCMSAHKFDKESML